MEEIFLIVIAICSVFYLFIIFKAYKLRKIKEIFIFGSLGWGIPFGIIFTLYRFYVQENFTPIFGSWIIFMIVCLVAGSIVGYFIFKNNK